MVVLRVGTVTRYAMFLAVRLFGVFAWHGRKKRRGRHVAHRFPEKSTDRREDLLAEKSSP